MSEVSLSDISDLNDRLYAKIAKEFFEQITQNSKEVGIKFASLKNAKLQKWANPIRLLIVNDGHTIEEIREVFKYLRDEDVSGKEFTWKSNVQCTETLRKVTKNGLSKFENILMVSRKAQPTPKVSFKQEEINQKNQRVLKANQGL